MAYFCTESIVKVKLGRKGTIVVSFNDQDIFLWIHISCKRSKISFIYVFHFDQSNHMDLFEVFNKTEVIINSYHKSGLAEPVDQLGQLPQQFMRDLP